MGQMCPWNIEDLDYDGLCSHSCLTEALVRNLELSAEELEAAAALYKLRRKETRHKSVSKAKKANPAEWQRKKTARNTTRRLNNPQAIKKEAKNHKLKVVAEKRYYCAYCDVAVHTPGLLQEHLETKQHKARVARKEDPEEQKRKPHYCAICDIGFPKLGNLEKHLASAKHKAKAAARKDFL